MALFSFLFRRPRDAVRNLLERHRNRGFSKCIQEGERAASRCSASRPVWIVPADDARNPQFDEAFAVLSKDIGPEGISLIHVAPIESNQVLVGLEDEGLLDFVRCRVVHSTAIGLGYFQIGTKALEVAFVSPSQLLTLRRHAAELAQEIGSEELIAVEE